MRKHADNAGPPEGAAGREAVPGTAAFSKFVAILQLVADNPGKLGMAELCTRAGMPRATVYRIVAALRAEGFIDGAERFALGPRLICLASQSWAEFDLRTLARDEIEELWRRTGETVHLAVPSGAEMVYIDKLDSPQAVRMSSRIGTRVMLHSTSVGKAYLAALAPEVRTALLANLTLLPMTPQTLTRREDLDAEIERTIAQGYACDSEENEPGTQCLGAAINSPGGVPVGAISLSIPRYRFDAAAAASLPALVTACAERISTRYALYRSPAAD